MGDRRQDSTGDRSRTSGCEQAQHGLTSHRGPVIRKGDATIAKNYLSEEELHALNNLVEQYLLFAEGQAMRRIPMRMADWAAKLDSFLQLNDRGVLTDAGRVSRELADQTATREFEKFDAERRKETLRIASDFDAVARSIEQHKPLTHDD